MKTSQISVILAIVFGILAIYTETLDYTTLTSLFSVITGACVIFFMYLTRNND